MFVFFGSRALRGVCGVFLALCLSSGAAAFASEVDLPKYLVSGWDVLSGKMMDALSLRDKQETLPDSSFFGPDKSSNAKKIDKTVLWAKAKVLGAALSGHQVEFAALSLADM